MAGHETTANTLAWTWFLLSQHPEAEARLHEELASGARRPAADGCPTCPRLPYTESVINETLRVYPTVWMVGRENIEPVELGGYLMPVGTTVFMPQWVIHRDAALVRRSRGVSSRAVGGRLDAAICTVTPTSRSAVGPGSALATISRSWKRR